MYIVAYIVLFVNLARRFIKFWKRRVVMLKYAIVGFGGIGKVHFSCYDEIKKEIGDIELVAICDREAAQFTQHTATNLGENKIDLDLSRYNLYTDVDDMLAKEPLDFVLVALPTFLHAEYAVKIMDRGIPVFCEKPMALTESDAKKILDAAKRNNVALMIGHCERYNSKYMYLGELIKTKKYGKVIRAHFSRLTATPLWSKLLLDESKSGGVALDMHVHDVDLINAFFGVPDSLVSRTSDVKTKCDTVVTEYYYNDGPVVSSVADWSLPQGYPFSAEFLVAFEKAALEFKSGVLTLYVDGEQPEILELHETSAHAAEVIDFAKCLIEKRESEINPADQSYSSTVIALTEKHSAAEGKPVRVVIE